MESHINPIVFENALPKLKHTNNTQKHSFSTTNKLDICRPFGTPDLKIPPTTCNIIIDFETFPSAHCCQKGDQNRYVTKETITQSAETGGPPFTTGTPNLYHLPSSLTQQLVGSNAPRQIRLEMKDFQLGSDRESFQLVLDFSYTSGFSQFQIISFSIQVCRYVLYNSMKRGVHKLR